MLHFLTFRMQARRKKAKNSRNDVNYEEEKFPCDVYNKKRKKKSSHDIEKDLTQA